MNKRGEKPLDLLPDDQPRQQEGPVDLLAGDSITRFDKAKKKKKKKGSKSTEGKTQEAKSDKPTKSPQDHETKA